MTDVKRLAVTDTTYNHRGWNWRDRAMYDHFKPYMKLPTWVDRILTNGDGSAYYVVGKKDGENNAAFVGYTYKKTCTIPEQDGHFTYNCNTAINNYFQVVAERARARQVDPNKVARPAWRAPLVNVWEPPMLEGTWVMSREHVGYVGCSKAPEWADRLWVSTSNNEDTFVWVDSKSARPEGGYTNYKAQGAKGIKGRQSGNLYQPDSVLTHGGCHWQLAGVRKKTVHKPVDMVVEAAPIIIKPSPDKPVTATEVREAQREMERVPTGRVPSLNDLICAPYGCDIYSQIAARLNITRAEAKLRAFRDAYQPPRVFDFAHFDFAALEQRAFLAFAAPKPPVGVKPRNLHDEERANALDEAMVRYLNEDLPFPIEWATEWNELRARLNKEQK